LPRLLIRQWVLSVPKRLRYHLEQDQAVERLALRIFLSVVEQAFRRKQWNSRSPRRPLVAGCCQYPSMSAYHLGVGATPDQSPIMVSADNASV
jgi:hypothetical protein